MDLGFKGDFEYLGYSYTKLPFRTLWANDWDEHAVAVYNHNFKTTYVASDIRNVDFEALDVSAAAIDVLIAGFPCQDFSLSGPREGLLSDRGRLYMHIRRALDFFKPKMVFAENVPGIEYPPVTLELIGDAISEAGTPQYNLDIYKFNAADFGVPQIRRRVILVGTRRDLEIDFWPPQQSHRPPTIDLDGRDVPRWMRNSVQEDVTDLEGLPTWLTAKKAIDDVWCADGTEDSPVADQDKRTRATIVLGKRKRRDRQLQADLPSPTIRSQHHGHIEVHYRTQSDGSLRRLTIRECARLQGFPDSFEFPTSASQAYVQIGNAMPPVAVHRWATAIAGWLAEVKLESSNRREEKGRVVRSKAQTSKIMRAVKAKDSKAERILGSAMWSKGLRYRKHARDLPGTPDFVFIRHKVAVFCDGDFWHGRGWERRGFTSWEEQFDRIHSSDFWRKKISANMERDRRVRRELEGMGWVVLRFLESEILDDVESCALKVRGCVDSPRIK